MEKARASRYLTDTEASRSSEREECSARKEKDKEEEGVLFFIAVFFHRDGGRLGCYVLLKTQRVCVCVSSIEASKSACASQKWVARWQWQVANSECGWRNSIPSSKIKNIQDGEFPPRRRQRAAASVQAGAQDGGAHFGAVRARRGQQSWQGGGRKGSRQRAGITGSHGPSHQVLAVKTRAADGAP